MKVIDCVSNMFGTYRTSKEDIDQAVQEAMALSALSKEEFETKKIAKDLTYYIHAMSTMNSFKMKHGPEKFKKFGTKLVPLLRELSMLRVDDPWDDSMLFANTKSNTAEAFAKSIRSDALLHLCLVDALAFLSVMMKVRNHPWYQKWLQLFASNHDLWCAINNVMFEARDEGTKNDMNNLLRQLSEISSFLPSIVDSFRGKSPHGKKCMCSMVVLRMLVKAPKDITASWIQKGLFDELFKYIDPVSSWNDLKKQTKAHQMWDVIKDLSLEIPQSPVKDFMLAHPIQGEASVWSTLFDGWTKGHNCHCDIEYVIAFATNPKFAEHLRPRVADTLERILPLAPSRATPTLLRLLEEVKTAYQVHVPGPMVLACTPKARTTVHEPPREEIKIAPMLASIPAGTDSSVEPKTKNKTDLPIIGRCCLTGSVTTECCSHDSVYRYIRSPDKYMEITCSNNCVSLFHATVCFAKWTQRKAHEERSNGWSFWDKLRVQGVTKLGKTMPRRVDPVTDTEYAYLACPTEGCAAHVVSVRKYQKGSCVATLLDGIPKELMIKDSNVTAPKTPCLGPPIPLLSIAPTQLVQPLATRNHTIHVRNYVPHEPTTTRKTQLDEVTPLLTKTNSLSAAPLVQDICGLFSGSENPSKVLPRKPIQVLPTDSDFPSAPLHDIQDRPCVHPFGDREALPSQTPFVGLFNLPVDKINTLGETVHMYIVKRLSPWGVRPDDVVVYPELRAAAVRTASPAINYDIRQFVRNAVWINQRVEAITLTSFLPFS